jgi:hypothetical protein
MVVQRFEKLSIVSLYDNSYIELPYFPTEISTEEGANYQPQDTTTGVRPLFYANRDGQHITFQVWIDRTDPNQSIEPEINKLRAWMKEVGRGGESRQPPMLLLACGDWRPRVVLERMNVRKTLFNSSNQAIRAEVHLTFIGIPKEPYQYESLESNPPILGRRGRVSM